MNLWYLIIKFDIKKWKRKKTNSYIAFRGYSFCRQIYKLIIISRLYHSKGVVNKVIISRLKHETCHHLPDIVWKFIFYFSTCSPLSLLSSSVSICFTATSDVWSQICFRQRCECGLNRPGACKTPSYRHPSSMRWPSPLVTPRFTTSFNRMRCTECIPFVNGHTLWISYMQPYVLHRGYEFSARFFAQSLPPSRRRFQPSPPVTGGKDAALGNVSPFHGCCPLPLLHGTPVLRKG